MQFGTEGYIICTYTLISAHISTYKGGVLNMIVLYKIMHYLLQSTILQYTLL